MNCVCDNRRRHIVSLNMVKSLINVKEVKISLGSNNQVSVQSSIIFSES